MASHKAGLGPLTESSLAHAVACLARRDPDLSVVVAGLGPPPLWGRRPGFATLIHIILEQQVSLASARAAYRRLEAARSPLTPETFLTLDDSELKAIGFSRQKTSYGRNLAQAVIHGRLDMAGLGAKQDDAVRADLMSVKGIGRWTADIYLLMALGRPDVWPVGDLALAVATQKVKQLPSRPTDREMDSISKPWQPLRAVAARILWHYYLENGTRG
jgi:DNA-3-methyladenine glycosylase II